jgi:hypothetical protein
MLGDYHPAYQRYRICDKIKYTYQLDTIFVTTLLCELDLWREVNAINRSALTFAMTLPGDL